ncbi:transporter [Oxalobacteraceae bacterium OTU3REALA1]|nr:transporter [Oxalobacteraceae bacterium OTU3REALA1]
MAIKNMVVVLLMLPALALAAEDEIATDRPDFVESSNVVGKGRFQIETSLAGDRNKADGIKDKAYATPTLLRYGVSEDWEVRLETAGRIRATSTDTASGVRSKESGYGDVSLGVKWHVADEQGARPSIGVLAHVDLDSGSAPFRAQGKGTSLRMVAEWELANDFSLGVMPGIASQVNDDGDRYTGGILGIVVGKGWTDEFRSFVEYSSEQIAHVRDGGTSSSLNAGVAYLLTKTVQLDTALSRGLNSRTPDWGWTVGLSMKF